MTPEQKQRIEQIEKARQYEWVAPTWADVDFLIPLIKESREDGFRDALSAAKTARARVGMARNCYDAPNEAESVAAFIVAAIERAGARAEHEHYYANKSALESVSIQEQEK